MNSWRAPRAGRCGSPISAPCFVHATGRAGLALIAARPLPQAASLWPREPDGMRLLIFPSRRHQRGRTAGKRSCHLPASLTKSRGKPSILPPGHPALQEGSGSFLVAAALRFHVHQHRPHTKDLTSSSARTTARFLKSFADAAITRTDVLHWLAKAYRDVTSSTPSSAPAIALAPWNDGWFAPRRPRAKFPNRSCLPGRGDDLVKSIRHGARALRRRVTSATFCGRGRPNGLATFCSSRFGRHWCS